MPTFFKVIFCFTWRRSGPLFMSITSWILKVMYLRVVFQQKKPGQTLGSAEGQWACSDQHTLCQMGMTRAAAPASLGVLHHRPVWAGQGDTRGSLLDFQPPGSVQAPTSKATQTCGSWHLLKVNSDTFYGSIFFLML